MSVLLGRGSQKLYTCSVGLNSPIFTGVSHFKFSESYFRIATRVLQRSWIFSPDGHERKLITLAGGQLPSCLHKEHRRCVMGQAIAHKDQPGSSLTRMILPKHQHVNGILKGSFLVDNIIEAATTAANRYCHQHIDSDDVRSHPDAALCFLSSFDYLRYVRPLKLIDAMFVKANVSATSDHLLRVEVSVEKNYPFIPDVFKLVNSARLSFITNDHPDWSQRHHVKSQKIYIGAPGDIHLLSQSTPSKLMDSSGHAKGDSDEVIPAGSSLSFIQPYDCMPPLHLFCRPGHACKLMKDHGIITAARLTRHDVACVHIGPVTFHENIKMSGVVMTSGEVVSTSKDVLTLSQSVSLLSFEGGKIQRRCVAKGLFSYVPINSAKERVSVPGQQVLSGHGQRCIQDKEVDIQQKIVDSYANALKKL